ncbi:brix domain-containing protein [Dictyostelium discoideum AX4]|uniref:Ribosome biogenesis protein BRX1 homolog n=1 Tax=Dictyostelium discoideum TaxID=44689 RepID=BRX1_DICDI|nr:brix domain-containing protein [Dictyostelium discoideum AX4]Q54JN0.1 RecName: Full=Ribosome biogenesis protein BRX1 homolog; AltName: Full=Brix domain-containing protein 2 homolog [Dictyostelium discoideum]EAL63475.1 brix domain-containing protein [Dictyostelium discoideum AX4]|eukprot:XP_636982.1 brix domain-containing protein [Dictyostelium discoideum AX4]
MVKPSKILEKIKKRTEPVAEPVVEEESDEEIIEQEGSEEEEEIVEEESEEEEEEVEEENKNIEENKKDQSIYTKKRVLFTSTRGIGSKYRHLMADLISLIPHSKKEDKIDDRKTLSLINETCEMKSCNYAILFDVRKGTDCFLWMAKTPLGPTVKFHITNVHTLDELQMTGNCLKGSRPFLHFDKSFDSEVHLQLIKELITQIYSTPKGHVKSKPFFDHVFSFFYQDGRIWFRNYQISDQEFKKDSLLTEIGPRMIMHIDKIFSDGFGGSVLYSNPNYVSPNNTRSDHKLSKANKYIKRKYQKGKAEERQKISFIEPSEVDTVFDN